MQKVEIDRIHYFLGDSRFKAQVPTIGPEKAWMSVLKCLVVRMWSP